jgi:CDP-diacylglycerol--serine O-phosphatidyltransferase
MTVQAQFSENGFPRPRRRLGRTVFILPSIFTVGNIFCGYYAIISTMRAEYNQAALAIGIAIILDALDGKIARLTNSATDFGLQLDSLADVISFGIAPSILAFFWALASVDYRLGWIAAFAFAICGAMRLARFNIQAGNLKHFIGLPIPAGGGAIAAIVHFVQVPPGKIGAGILVATVFVISFLMISTFKYSSLKSLTLGRRSHFTILIMALLVALIYNYSGWTLLALAVGYAGSGPAVRVYAIVRRRRRIAKEVQLHDPLEDHPL